MKHFSTNIYWSRDAEHIRVSHLDWNELIDEFECSGALRLTTFAKGYKTSTRFWHYNSFRIVDDTSHKYIYYCGDSFDDLYIFECYDDEEKNEEGNSSGTNAIKVLNSMMKSMCGVSLKEAFGCIEPSGVDYDTPKPTNDRGPLRHYDTEVCNEALAPIISKSENIYRGILNNGWHKKFYGYKADFSSAYPSQSVKPLPTMDGAQRIEGQVEPKEGEVVYWLKSGHVIEYDGIDTRKLMVHPLYKNYQKFRQVEPKDDISLVLKYSKYSLSGPVNKMYESRKDDKNIKSVMVSMYGMMRSRRFFQHQYMGHISALVYARHITAMCEVYDEIIHHHYVPVLYATDSIIWKGGPLDITVPKEEKTLGAFVEEFANCPMYIHAAGVYGIEQDGKLMVVKHQGCAYKPANITNLDEYIEAILHKDLCIKEFYDHQTHKYVMKEASLV